MNEQEEYNFSSFNPRNKNGIIETDLSYLEERLLDTEIPSIQQSYKEVREALYSLIDDPGIIIIGPAKGAAVVAWD